MTPGKPVNKERCKGTVQIGNIRVEEVISFNYLGSLLTATNNTNEEATRRICLGMKAFYSLKWIPSNKIIKKSTKLKIYKTLIRPIITSKRPNSENF